MDLSLPGVIASDTRHNRWLYLVSAVERLASADSMETIIRIVRETARTISGADGVTFVLRDDDKCHYVDEDAIGPLWKGRKFPLTACISGWCMLNRKMAVIPDIYVDPRIPHDAYRPTFVKSLIMVPVRAQDPLASIGSYWSETREFSAEEVSLLEGLSRSTAAAIAAVQARDKVTNLQSEIAHFARRTEMGQMGAEIAHEITQPMTASGTYLRVAMQQLSKGEPAENVVAVLEKVETQIDRAARIIERIRGFVSPGMAQKCPEDVAPLIADAVEIARMNPKFRQIDISVQAGDFLVKADKVQIQQVLLNIVRNALEAVVDQDIRKVSVAAALSGDGKMVQVSVDDTGPGLDPAVAERLFQPFVTTKAKGMGVGLSACRTIVQAHGGRIWVNPSHLGGAQFCFTLPCVAETDG